MNRLKFEIRRKLLHLVLGSSILLGFHYEILDSLMLFGIILCGVITSIIEKERKLPIVSKMLDLFERPEFRTRFPGKGTIFFVFGALLAIQLFERDIALASIAVLTFSDAVTPIIGIYYNEKKNREKKFIVASVFGMCIGFLAARIFINPLYALFAAAGGTAADFFEFEINKSDVDDNILVPLAAGTAILLLRRFLGL